MTNPFTIKRLTAEDGAILGHIAPGVFDAPIHPERLRRYLRAPEHLLLLALEGDLVVGQCAAVVHHHPDKPDELYIDEVGTADTHLRRGIATAMVGEMLGWGRELGCADGWLATERDNDAANFLYRKVGLGPGETMVYYEFEL